MTVGVVVGLVVGKPVGVLAASWLAVRSGIGRLAEGTTWRHLTGLGLCAGIGFTVALFVTGLSFDDPAAIDAAKVGILAASLAAGLLGYGLLRTVKVPDDIVVDEATSQGGAGGEPSMAGPEGSGGDRC